MAGAIADPSDPIALKHLGAVVKFDVYDIPATATKFVFTATGMNISGDFTYDKSDASPAIETSAGANNTVTITFSAGSMSSASFYIPVPAGTYSSGFSVALKDDLDVSLLTKTRSSSFTVARGQYSMQSAIGCNTSGVDEIWSGTHTFDGSWEDRLDLRSATDWSSLVAGTQLVLDVDLNDMTEWIRLRVEDGWMAALPDHPFIHFVAGQTKAKIILSADDVTRIVDRGGVYLITGSGITITSVKLVSDNQSYDKRTVQIWSNASYFATNHNTGNDLAWGGFNWEMVEPGTMMKMTFDLNPTPASPGWWALTIGKGSNWADLTNPVRFSFDGTETYVEFEITQSFLDCVNSNNGLIVLGTDVDVKTIELSFCRLSSAKTIIWNGSWTCSEWNYTQDFDSSKFDWAGLGAGKTVRFYITPSLGGGTFSIKHLGAGWPHLTDHSDVSVGAWQSYVDITTTATDMSEIAANGGVIISGTGYTLTQVAILK